MKYKHRETGEEYEPATYENGRYRLTLEFESLADFGRFARIAHSARMLRLSNGQKNVVSFSELEEI